MKWYFVLNDTAHPSYVEVAKIAVVTCRQNTTLEANIVYDGQENDFTAWLRANGVKVHFRSVPFLQQLIDRNGQRGLRTSTARGAYLRFVIPEIEETDEFVLYTDCDVVFQSDPVCSLQKYRPRFLGATVEHSTHDTSYFNSGVMLINVAALKPLIANMYAFITDALPYWGGFSPNDQGGFNYFFRGNWSAIDPTYNWKPYWGINENAKIIHYHGSRPSEILHFLRNGTSDSKSIHRNDSFRDPERRKSLLYYAKKYYSLLSSICRKQTVIRSAILQGQTLFLRFELGDDADFLFGLEFVVVSGTRVLTEFFVERGPLRRSRGELQLTWADADSYADEPDLEIRGRDLDYLRARIDVRDVAPSLVADRLVICRPEEGATGPDGNGCWSVVRDKEVIRRSWILPGLSFRVLAEPDSSGASESEISFDDLLRWKAAAGPVWRLGGRRLYLTPGLRAVLREGGTVVSEEADLSEVITALGVASEDFDDEAREIHVDGRPDIIVDEAHDVILANNGDDLNRALSVVLQLGALKSRSEGSQYRLAVVGGGEVERQTLEHLGVEASYFSGPKGELICFERARVCFGAGLKAATAANVFDETVFRSGLDVRRGDRSIVYLDSGEIIPNGVVKALLGANAQWIDCKKSTMSEILGRVSGGAIIVIADSSVAELLAFARRDASVVHMSVLPADTGEKIRRLSSLRNLLYSQIDMKELDDHSVDADAATRLGALFARVFDRMVAATVSICSPR